MGRELFPLETIEVASPCPVAWEQMEGDDRVRFCGECNLHVYNLSGMHRDEAEALVASQEGELCVRLLRRPDGTVITQDCPIGLRALRRRLWRGLVAAASLAFALLFGFPKAEGAAPPPRKPQLPLIVPLLKDFNIKYLDVTLGRWAPGKGPNRPSLDPIKKPSRP